MSTDIKKNWRLSYRAVQKSHFWKPNFGVLKELYLKVSEDEIPFAAQQLYTKIGF